MTKARHGILAAAITPFGADGSVDANRLVAYCRHLLNEGGCDGVAPTGTTGEATSIALADRLALPAAFAKAGIAPDKVIFGTGAPAVGDCIGLTRAAVEAGYLNVLVLPPYYYKTPAEDGLFAYYAQLVEAIGRDDLRIYLYHFPQMSAVPIPVSLVTRLRAAFGPVIAGLKDSSGDFAQTRAFIEATGGREAGFDVFPSSEALLWDGLAIGAAGVISGSTNAFGRLARAALTAPEGPAREQAMAAVRAARDVAARYPMTAAMKQIEAWRSGDETWLRMLPPLTPLSQDQRRSLRADLDALGFFAAA